MTDPEAPSAADLAPRPDVRAGDGERQGGGAARDQDPAVGRRWRREAWALLELFALCGLVVVQPMLDVIGRSPDFFIFHGAGTADVVLLVLLFTLVPPVVLWGAGVLAGLAGPPVRRGVHAATAGGLFTLLAIQVGKQVSNLRGGWLAVFAVAAAVLMVIGYLRFPMTRQVLRLTAAGPVVFALLFAFASPASALVLNRTGPQAAQPVRATGPHPPVVVLLFDELPLVSLLDGAGRIDAERFPHFAKLAGESTWYRNATSVAGWTPYAVPAMLTGRYPARPVAGHYVEYPDNLFTLLGDFYQADSIETVTHLCPPWHCGERAGQAGGGLPVMLRESATLLGEIVSPAEPGRDPTTGLREPTVAERLGAAAAAAEHGPEFLFNQARAENRPARFQDFLSRLPEVADAQRPTLHFLHLLLPHSPWNYLPSGIRYEAPPGLPIDGDEWFAQLARQRHLLQAEYTDRVLGETIQALRQVDRYHDALVIVTSDHGHSFTPGAAGRDLDPARRGLAELAWVPLFIKEPGQTEGGVDDRNWQHVDLLPTIADYAGIEVAWPTDGISALRGERREPGKVFYDSINRPVRFDGPEVFASVWEDPRAVPDLPALPRPDLIGAAVDPALVTVPAIVDNHEALADVRPEDGVVPALIHGRLPGGTVPAGSVLAIAVNGRIAAVAPPVVDGGGTVRFFGLVPDEAFFVAGANRVELFLVAADGVERP